MWVCSCDVPLCFWHETFGKIKYFFPPFFIFIAEALFYVISVKITVQLSNELLNPFVNEQWSFSFSESHQRMDYVQTDSGANKNALLQSLSEH